MNIVDYGEAVELPTLDKVKELNTSRLLGRALVPVELFERRSKQYIRFL